MPLDDGARDREAESGAARIAASGLIRPKEGIEHEREILGGDADPCVLHCQLHRIARIWNTPVLGEFFMALSRPGKLAEGLAAQGMPADIAREEAEQWRNKDKRRAILKLYRSARGLSFAHDWALDIPKLPANGTLIWGEDDPYVELSVARRYATNTGTPLTVIEGAGHWRLNPRGSQLLPLNPARAESRPYRRPHDRRQVAAPTRAVSRARRAAGCGRAEPAGASG